MGRAKDIVLRVIPAKTANDFVKKHHYSGKVVQNSSLHFGAFLDGRLHGVMQFGSPLDKRKVLGLVEGTLWNEMLELNRMAFDEHLPKNSESRCLAIAFRLIRKNAPQVKWVLSFADGTQCGDGAIYRASGFVLTSIKINRSVLELPDGYCFAQQTVSAQGHKGGRIVREEVKKRISQTSISKGKYILGNGKASVKDVLDAGAKWLEGHQLRYIYLLYKTCKLNCPIIPFSKIDELDAGMYRGEKITLAERRKTGVQSIDGDVSGNQSEEGGSTPT